MAAEPIRDTGPNKYVLLGNIVEVGRGTASQGNHFGGRPFPPNRVVFQCGLLGPHTRYLCTLTIPHDRHVTSERILNPEW